MKRFSLLGVLIALFFVTVTNAQTVTVDDFSIEISPELPRPGELVTATVQSYAVDIDELIITWVYGGKQIANGIGVKSVNVLAGSAGVNQTLEASVRLSNGQLIKKSTIVAPSNLTVLWEAPASSAPPFYKGKTLVAPESVVRVTAFPDNGALAKNYSYNWRKNDSNLAANSGYGKTSYLYRSSYLSNQDKISASIGQSGGSTGTGSAIIVFERPTVAFYRKINGFIDYARKIRGSYAMNRDVETFVAEPLHFSVTASAINELTLRWFLGNQEATAGDRPNEIVLNRNNSSGDITVKIDGRHPTYLLQYTTDDFRLNF